MSESSLYPPKVAKESDIQKVSINKDGSAESFEVDFLQKTEKSSASDDYASAKSNKDLKSHMVMSGRPKLFSVDEVKAVEVTSEAQADEEMCASRNYDMPSISPVDEAKFYALVMEKQPPPYGDYGPAEANSLAKEQPKNFSGILPLSANRQNGLSDDATVEDTKESSLFRESSTYKQISSFFEKVKSCCCCCCPDQKQIDEPNEQYSDHAKNFDLER